MENFISCRASADLQILGCLHPSLFQVGLFFRNVFVKTSCNFTQITKETHISSPPTIIEKLICMHLLFLAFLLTKTVVSVHRYRKAKEKQ